MLHVRSYEHENASMHILTVTDRFTGEAFTCCGAIIRKPMYYDHSGHPVAFKNAKFCQACIVAKTTSRLLK